MAVPRIGVTRGLSASRPADAIPGVYATYHVRVCDAGGEAIDLHPAMTASPERLLTDLDGVLISGGPDINPARYGQAPHPETAGISDARDALEIGIIRAAIAASLPVFAICRGHQALNVAFGGSLLQHIDGDGHRAHDGGAGASRFHAITIADGSRLARLVGAGPLRTNSRHHQAVTSDGLAPGLTATAWSPDGLVEAMESREHRWVMGVQWHPERDEVKDRFRPLFEDFIRAATRVRAPAGAGG